jgi:beta-glucosidase
MRTMRRAVAVCALLLFAIPFIAQTKPTPAEVEKRVDAILSKMTLEEKIDYISGTRDFYVRAMPNLNVPELKMSDGPIGVRNYGPSTTYAAGIGLAATWNPELAQQVGAGIGRDARARGVHFMLGPGVNIYRAPMNGRNFEYFGEDPYLASRIAVGYIEGMQAQGVSATIKHYMGNNSEYDRHNTNSIIEERAMREIYLPVFEAAVKEAHVGSVMDSYNLINGQHATQNDFLNNQILKKDWGFQGIAMSDWDATYDGVAAANGGLDLEMPSGKFMNRETLLPAVKSGKVSQAVIDDKVRRILRVAVEFGWLDRDQTELSISTYNGQNAQVALAAAREAMVLLKNEGGVFPLDKTKIKSIAVIGPDAYPGVPVGGGSAQVAPYATVSYLEGISSYLGPQVAVYYRQGVPRIQEIVENTDYIRKAGEWGGVKAEYFANANWSGKPAVTRPEEHIELDPRGHFTITSGPMSARWTGTIQPAKAGEYNLYVARFGEQSTYKLTLDGKQILQTSKAAIDQQTVKFEAGKPHTIVLEFVKNDYWDGVGFGMIKADEFVDPEAKLIAAKADATIVLAGFDPTTESEGSDRTFSLPFGQDELIQAVAAANKKTAVVITSGGGVDMTKWIDQVPVIIEAWYPGQEGGTALAQLAFGDYSPSGKLPASFERRWEDDSSYKSYYPNVASDPKGVKYTEGVFVGYRHFDKDGVKPLFPFGYGLSYTTFKYSNLSVTPAAFKQGQDVTVSFDVTNTGSREGAEIGEVYVGDKHASVPRPVKELKGFSKVDLKPGETKRVTVALNPRAFQYWDEKGKKWKADAGEFDVLVGPSSADVALTGKATLE